MTHIHRRSLALALLALSASVRAQQPIPIRQLGPAEAVSRDTVKFLYGVRELSDGRVLANDAGARRLLLFDRALATATVVADSATGFHTPYGKRTAGIIPFVGDTTLLVDVAGRAFVAIDPGGKVARVMSPPRPNDVAVLANPAFGAPRLDPRGRLIYRSQLMPAFRFPEADKPFTPPELPDSAPVVRADFETRTADTLAWLRTPRMRITTTPIDGGGLTMRSMINPVAFVDDWAALPDGSVAILRGRDYHIDWVGADGTRTSSPKMPFDWKRLTDDEKAAIVDSTRKALARQVAAASAGGAPGAAVVGHSMTMMRVEGHDGGPPPRAAGGAPPVAMGAPEVVPPSDLPDYMPPVLRPGNMIADLAGNLWILPSTSTQSAGGLLYDVVDREGRIRERVRLPAGRALAGFGAGGAVYLTARDSTGTRIERTRTQSAAAPDSGVRVELAGVWEGTFQADHGRPGTFRLVIAAESGWTVTPTMTYDERPLRTRIHDFRMVGHDVAWTQELRGQSCKSTAVLAARTLRGESSCGHGSISFLLRKR